MKKILLSITAALYFCTISFAQESVATVSNSSPIFGYWEMSMGRAGIDRLNFDFLRDVYSKPGQQISFSFSLGSERYGFCFHYLFDRFFVDLKKTKNQNYQVVDVRTDDVSRQVGIVVGPYFNQNFRFKNFKNLWFDLMPGMGVMYQKSAAISGETLNGGIFHQGSVEKVKANFFLGTRLRYNFGKRYAAGIRFNYCLFWEKDYQEVDSNSLNIFFLTRFKL